jgi:hypothetical protein
MSNRARWLGHGVYPAVCHHARAALHCPRLYPYEEREMKITDIKTYATWVGERLTTEAQRTQRRGEKIRNTESSFAC